MQERKFELSYSVVGDNTETYDVSFEVTKEVESALFDRLADIIEEDARGGVLNEQHIHLYKQLVMNKRSYRPWFESEDDFRTYDLELSSSDYQVLSDIIGRQVQSTTAPWESSLTQDLVEMWEKITDQMEIYHGIESWVDELKRDSDLPDGVSDPENGTFKGFTKTGTVAVYENERTGDVWYKCLSCNTLYSEIGENHSCDR